MKDNLILLADLLANDDNFAADFSSRKFADDKFKLAKSKLKNLEKEEFTEFLESLQSLEKIDQKLPLDKLQNVSGGVGGHKTKLAALTFLSLALTPLASMGTEIASAHFPLFYQKMYTKDEKEILDGAQSIVAKIKNLKIPSFYFDPTKPKPKKDYFKINLDTIRDLYKKLAKVENDSFTECLSNLDPKTKDLNNYFEGKFYETDLGKKYKELDNRRLYYVNIYNNVIKKTIKNDTFFEKNKKSLNGFDRLILKTNLGDYTISKSDYTHIIYGEYSYNYAALQYGGHSSKARQLLKKIYFEKAEKDTDTDRKNKFIEKVIKNEENLPEDEKGSVTKDGQRKSTSKIGMKTYHLTDSSEAVPNEGQDANYKYFGHTFFPKNFDERGIINAIKACIENDDVTIDPKTGKKSNGTRKPDGELTYNFHAMINGVPIRVITSEKNEIKTAYPLIDVHEHNKEFYCHQKKLNSVNIDLSADPFASLTAPLNNNDNNNELTTSPEPPSNRNDGVQYGKRNTISKSEANAINKKHNESGTIQTQKNKFAGLINESSDDEEYYDTKEEDNNDNVNFGQSSTGSESGRNTSSNDSSDNEHSYGTESDSSDGSNSKNINDSTKSQLEKEQNNEENKESNLTKSQSEKEQNNEENSESNSLFSRICSYFKSIFGGS